MHNETDGKTKVCGLMGHPVEHTLSPVIHNMLAEMMGINLVYVPFDVEKGNEKAAVEGAYALNVTGMNVTVPHKSAVIPYLAGVDRLAGRIGAVNTLVRKNGCNGFWGYNTDITGLKSELQSEGISLKDRKVIILGAGGVARTVAYLCCDEQAASICIINRTSDKAKLLAKEVSERMTYNNARVGTASEFIREKHDDEKYICFQCTQVGLFPNTEEAVIEDEAFYRLVDIAVDMVYRPVKTMFMRLAENAGCRAISGLKMLLYQGIASFELWNNVKTRDWQADRIYEELLKRLCASVEEIILIGFMGSGKSTVGKRLAADLGWNYQDSDAEIEKEQGMSVSEIFREKGESAFRDMETEWISKEAKAGHKRTVIAVGGGLALRRENREHIHNAGIAVLLKTRPETVYERLKGDDTRPLLKCADPITEIRKLESQREEYYMDAADHIVETDGKTPEQIAEEIIMKCGIEKRNKILVINGPNLNFLGIREKDIYGTQNYEYLLSMIRKKAADTNTDIETWQSNHEGDIIDRIQKSYSDGTTGIVINPGAYTHYSYAIHDALKSIENVIKVEVHISDITSREEFRKVSVTAPACDRQIYGHGFEGYLEAIDFIIAKTVEK